MELNIQINTNKSNAAIKKLKRKAFWLRLKLKIKVIFKVIAHQNYNIYEMSDDYEVLWNLVNEKQRVPCLIPIDYYTVKNIAQFYKTGSHYELNSSGRGYSFGIETKDEFIAFCKENRIEFFNPLCF